MATNAEFAPDKIIIEKRGRMVVMYYSTGKAEKEHVASFFHEYKAKYVTDALKAQYGVKVVNKKSDQEVVKPADKAKGKTTTKKVSRKS